MKHLSGFLLIAILSLSSFAFTPPAPVPAPASGRNLECHNVRLVRICAWVEEGVVRPGSSVTVYGSITRKGEGVAGQLMRVVWSARTTETCLGVTDSTGVASCTTYVPSYWSSNRSVNVKVWMDKYKINTHFRIKVGSKSSRADE